EFRSILGLSFNSAGELFGWHDPGADDPVRIDKATGAATTIGDAGISTGGQVIAFDNSDKLMLVQGGTVYEIDTDTGMATRTETLPFNPGSGGGDINNTTGDLWASATRGNTQDSIIRVTDDEADTFTDIDTDVEYLNALAFGGTGDFQPDFPTVTVNLNFDFDTGTAATAFGASASATATPGTDYEETFYSDAALTKPITSVTLGGSNPASVDVYVKTFDNDPPFNEADENVKVELTGVTGATEGDTSAIGTITDATEPTITISDAADEAEGTALKYVVSLNGDTEVAVTADLGFGAGTAMPGTDYEEAFYSDAALTKPITSVILGGGNPTSVDIYVKTFDNDPPFNEADENVKVELTGITNAIEGDTSADGTITDPTDTTIDISDAADEAEGSTLKCVVSLNGDTDVAVTANLGFGAGTATAGSDYEAKFYSDKDLRNQITLVTLGGGNPISMEVYVKTLTDGLTPEGMESVIVTVSGIQNAAPGDTSGSGAIIDVPPPPTINDATDTGNPPDAKASEESSEKVVEEVSEEESEESSERAAEESVAEALGEGPADPAEEATQKEADKFEAEVEALIAEQDFSETTEGPAAGKPDAQQPQTRAQEVAEIMSIMDKAAALVTQCGASQGPFL
ncbi:MAG: hypothetical protein GQ537_00430, partial [Gammaproteobacteria bacterium]|nr:hypothetical protein [Gammaproteobacteria bacterium]